MVELSNYELININGGVDPSILDLINPKNIYESGKKLCYDLKAIINNEDSEINDFVDGFVDGAKSAIGF